MLCKEIDLHEGNGALNAPVVVRCVNRVTGAGAEREENEIEEQKGRRLLYLRRWIVIHGAEGP